MAFLAGAYLYGFTLFAFSMAGLERWVGAGPQRVALFFVGVAAALAALSGYRRLAHDATLRIVYEDEADPVVRQLNLLL